MLKPWWEQWPGRLDYELRALQAAGIKIEQQTATGNRLQLRLKHTLNDEDIELVARFPEFYPYTRFEVYAPKLDLPRHQHPFEKNLCLLAQGTEHWKVSDILADFISNRLPRVIEAATSTNNDRVGEIEAHQGEPASHYYSYAPGATLLVDGSWTIPEGIFRGRLEIAITDAQDFRGTVLEISDSNERTIARCGTSLARAAQSSSRTITGRWVRLDSAISAGDAASFANALFSVHRNLREPRWRSTGKAEVDVICVLFPEEVAWRDPGLGWVFLVRVRRTGNGFREHIDNMLIRAGRAGEGDLRSRVPELHPLASKTVAVFGLGCVGLHPCWSSLEPALATFEFLTMTSLSPAPLYAGRWGYHKSDGSRPIVCADSSKQSTPTHRFKAGPIASAAHLTQVRGILKS
jgi:hypothetical protein